jgi:hypothetical protein
VEAAVKNPEAMKVDIAEVITAEDLVITAEDLVIMAEDLAMEVDDPEVMVVDDQEVLVVEDQDVDLDLVEDLLVNKMTCP